MTRAFAILLAFAVLCACAEPSFATRPQLVTCIHSAFEDDERTHIENAIFEWNTALQGVVVLAPELRDDIAVMGCRIAIMRVTSVTSAAPPAERGWTLGYTDAIGGTLIWIVADRAKSCMALVVAHEIGHALGLEHGPVGLMREKLTHAPVSAADAVWAAYELGLQHSEGR